MLPSLPLDRLDHAPRSKRTPPTVADCAEHFSRVFLSRLSSSRFGERARPEVSGRSEAVLVMENDYFWPRRCVPIVDSVGAAAAAAAAIRDRDRYSCVKRENGDQERTPPVLQNGESNTRRDRLSDMRGFRGSCGLPRQTSDSPINDLPFKMA